MSLHNPPTRIWRKPQPSSRAVLTWTLLALGIWSLFALGDISDLKPKSFSAAGEIFLAAFTPELSWSYLWLVIQDTFTTISYTIAIMSLALVLGALAGVVSSGVLLGKAVAVPLRFVMTLFRSIHELIWALLFVQVLGLSPWAGVLAIAIPYGSILGRIFADQIRDVDSSTLESLKNTGASKFSLLIYGYLPPLGWAMFSYATYRFECALRSAAVLSFIGLGGLGFRIEIALDDLDYSKAWTPIWMLILLIISFDLLASSSRTNKNSPEDLSQSPKQGLLK